MGKKKRAVLMKLFGVLVVLALSAVQKPAVASQTEPLYDIDRIVFESNASPHKSVAALGTVSGGLMLSLNNIVLADRTAARLIFVNIDSGDVKMIGRRGNGPGEFQVIRSIGRTSSGDVFVDDPHLARVSIFGAEGVLVKTIRYRPEEFRGFLWNPKAIGVNGDDAVVFRDPDPLISDRVDGPYRGKIDYVARLVDGRHVHIFQAFDLELVRYNCIPPGNASFSFNNFVKPFAYSTLEAVAGEFLVIGDTETGQIAAYNRMGNVAFDFALGRGMEVSKEDDRTWREQKIEEIEEQKQRRAEHMKTTMGTLAERLNFGAVCGDDGEARDFYRTYEGNEVTPAFSHLLIDGEDRIWVQPYNFGFDDENKWKRWRLYEKEGRLETIILFRGHELFDALSDRVLLRTTDQLGVDRIVVAELKRLQ